MMGTVWNCVEGAIFIWLTIYFYWIDKDWIWTQVWGLSLNVLACALLLFIPESPKYLYSEGRYKECFEVLKQMKKVNTGNASSGMFTTLVRITSLPD